MAALLVVSIALVSVVVNTATARAEEWQRIGSGGLAPGFNPMQGVPSKMCVFKSNLYVGTDSQGEPCEVWRYDGSSWSMVNTPGFGNRGNTGITSLGVFGGKLYAGTYNGDGCEVWRYDGAAWGKVSSSSNIGKSANDAASSMAAVSGGLYVGTFNIAGCEVWRYNGSAWKLCVGLGFGITANTEVASMTSSATGNVYAGTHNNNGCEVWKYDGIDWSKWNTSGFNNDANNDSTKTLCFYNNQLHAGTFNSSSGCEVWRNTGGTTWVQLNTDGFGNASNNNATCSAVFGSPSKLYVATERCPGGCKVMRYNGPNPASWTQVNSNGFGDTSVGWVASMAVFNSKLYVGANGGQGAVVYSTAGGATVPYTWGLNNTPGFTANDNEGASALAMFKGSLYAGTESGRGCQVRRFDGNAWTQVGSDGLGDRNNYAVGSMVATGTYLYAGLSNGATGGEVWRYDGSTWKRINTDGFGDATSNEVMSLVVFNSKLYAGTSSYNTHGKVWRYDGPNPSNWVLVNTPGFASVKNVGVQSLKVFNSKLYAGTFSSNDPASVWRYNGGTSWSLVSALGFGKPGNAEIDSIAGYNGKLYATCFNRAMTGAEVWRYNNGTSWTQVNSNGFGDSNTDWPTQMAVLAGKLYVGAGNRVTGGQVWSYDGTTWTKANTDGMVNVDNGMIMSLTTDGSRLYAGTDNGAGGCEVWASEPAGNSWYLAEGTTAWGFETYVTVQNPNASAKSVTVTYMTPGGQVDGGTLNLPAKSQTTVNPRDRVGTSDFSTKVTSSGSSMFAVDRTMYWTGPGAASPEAHSSVGVTAPAWEWYLPEGSSNWGFETWLLIQNPNVTQANCQVTYMTEGEAPQTFVKTVAANSRQSFNMASDIGNKDASIRVTSGVPVIPERSMYRNNRREGHDSIGTTTPALDYYLAEGTSAWGFTTYVLIQNPNSSACDVTITYMTADGAKPQTPFPMDANSRKTVRVNDYLPNTDFSTRVHGSAPIIAERAMYWNNGTGEACHDSIGLSAAHKTFYLPDGQSSEGRETWTLVQNPNGSAVTVEITYMTPSGTGNKVFTDTVPGNSRKTYSMADKLTNSRGAVQVVCKTAGKKIMVERAMYWNGRGAGTDTIGGYSD